MKRHAIRTDASACFLAVAIAFLLILPPTHNATGAVPKGNRRVLSGDWVVEWNKNLAMARNLKTKADRIIYRNQSFRGEENGCEESYTMLSILGPIVSFHYCYSIWGGVHPYYGQSISCINLETGAPVEIYALFPEAEVASAVCARWEWKEYFKCGDQSSLSAIIADPLDENRAYCGLNLEKMPSSFALVGVSQGNAVVYFGIGHGCEGARGSYTDFPVALKIRDEYRAELEHSIRQSLLMDDLAPEMLPHNWKQTAFSSFIPLGGESK